jgi:hypothetical protein
MTNRSLGVQFQGGTVGAQQGDWLMFKLVQTQLQALQVLDRAFK